LFETWVVAEFIKARFNQGRPADLYFWRDNNGLEADLLFESGSRLQSVEIKSGQTVTPDYVRAEQASAPRGEGDCLLAALDITGCLQVSVSRICSTFQEIELQIPVDIVAKEKQAHPTPFQAIALVTGIALGTTQ